MKVIDKLPSTLVIDRSRWYRGKGYDYSALIVHEGPECDHGKMCCLGFLALECGASREQIGQCKAPSSLANVSGFDIAPLLRNSADSKRRCTQLTHELMEANDRLGLRDEDRERLIKNNMAALGVTVTFIDGEVADGQ